MVRAVGLDADRAAGRRRRRRCEGGAGTAAVGGRRRVGAPAIDGDVRSDVVEDGGPPGSSGVSGEGSNRRRASAAALGSDDEIEGLRWLIEARRWSRRSREVRRRGWCEEISERGPPFIGARGAARVQ
jgi:hypothetical protein